MRQLRGVGASPGTAVGPAWLLSDELDVPSESVADVDSAVDEAAAALESTAADLHERAAAADGEAAQILEAQATMAQDPELVDGVVAAVRGGSHPARAVIDVGEEHAAALAAMDNEYLAARAADVRDVCARVARRLMGVADPDLGAITQPSIVVARDLSPAETATVDPAKVLAIVTEQGSRTSHTAILARGLGVPAVVAVAGVLEEAAAVDVIGVDGSDGTVAVELDDEAVEVLRERADVAREQQERRRATVPEGPAATADGHRVEVAANVATAAEVEAAVAAGAEGVGLLRTELAFLDRSDPPSEDEQAATFEAMVTTLAGRRLVIRTFDFGADKPVRFLDAPASPNPALGVRGIRLARLYPEVLQTQLRAVARAAGAGPIAVMAPMVATAEEAAWFVEQVRDATGGAVDVEVGVMVETPAAVLAPAHIAAAVDFLSIGTNDLVQYVHAADRQEGHLAALQDPFSPATLTGVRRVCEAAQAAGAWVGVCGEAGGDPAWAVLAVGLGVDELSMGAASILDVRAALAAVTLDDCRDAAARALEVSDAAQARAIAQELLS